MTTDTLPTGLRIARDGEPGWFYKSPSVTLWVTDAVDKSADPIDTTLALPYSGNSTTGLDGGEDVDPDGTSEDDTYYDDTPTNDPNPEFDPDYLAFLSDSLPVAPACVTIGALSRAPHTSSLASVPFNESGGQERFRKEIVRDREEGDFAMHLDTGQGFELVGFARNYSEADTTLDELIFAIRHQDTPGTDCPSCGDLLCEDAAVCAACRENGEGTAQQRDAGVPF